LREALVGDLGQAEVEVFQVGQLPEVLQAGVGDGVLLGVERLQAGEPGDCDGQRRAVGAEVPDVEEALEYLRQLGETCGE
jgi:hypothetical protein